MEKSNKFSPGVRERAVRSIVGSTHRRPSVRRQHHLSSPRGQAQVVHRIAATTAFACYQNALAERGNGVLKTEFLLHRPADIVQAARMVRQSVEI